MELYKLKVSEYNQPYDPNDTEFYNERKVWDRDTIIDIYESLIWTDRFNEAGDMRMLMPASHENVALVKTGTKFGLSTSKEIMVVESRSIKEGVITVTGKSLDSVIFNERYFAKETHWPIFAPTWTEPKTITAAPRQLIRSIAKSAAERYDKYDTNWRFPGLVISGLTDPSPTITEKITYGLAYPILTKYAQKYNVGFGVYYINNNVRGHDFQFQTHYGEDKRDQILFSPGLDNLANIEEMLSEEGYKNIAVALGPNGLKDKSFYVDVVFTNNIGLFASWNPELVPNRYMLKRFIEFENDDIIEAMLGTVEWEKEDKLREIMTNRAKAKLLEMKKKQIIDGEATSEAQFKYYTQPNPNNDPVYRLGDMVQIGGDFSKPMDAIITEFTQTADATGKRSFPTIAKKVDPPDTLTDGR